MTERPANEPCFDIRWQRLPIGRRRYCARFPLASPIIVSDLMLSNRCATTPGCKNEGGSLPFIVSGSLLFSSGALFATTGIPMWVLGGREQRKSQVGLLAGAAGVRLVF